LGRFREQREAALRRADIVIFASRRPRAKQSTPDKRLLRLMPLGISLYRSHLEGLEIESLSGETRLDACEAAAFCGLANPQGFFDTLKSAGFALIAARAFPDHCSFADGEIESLQREFPGVPLVCSQKDAVKLKTRNLSGIYVLRARTKVDPADAFMVQVRRAIARKPSRIQAGKGQIESEGFLES